MVMNTDTKFTAWTRNNLREIWKTRGRFLAILVIIMLGVSFYSGLLATKPAMIKGANNYINNESNMYDFRFLTTIGFTESDIDFYKTLDGVTAVEGCYSVDFFADTEFDSEFTTGTAVGSERILKAYSITKKINKIKLISGRMPTSENECLVDASAIGEDAIGTTITVSERNTNYTKSFFKREKYIVVGTCCTVNYLNRTRGTTALEGGSLDGFIYMLSDAFAAERMTEILIKTDASGDIFTAEYDNRIAGYADAMQAALDEHSREDYNSLRSAARKEIDEAWEQYNAKLGEFDSARDDAEQQLNDTLKTLNEGKAQLDESKKELDRAKKKIEQGEKEYRDGLKEYDENLNAYEEQREAALTQLYEAQGEIDGTRRSIEMTLALIDSSDAAETYAAMQRRLDELESIMAGIEDHNSPEYQEAYEEYIYLKAQMEYINDSGVIELYQKLLESQAQLDIEQEKLDRERERVMREFEHAKSELERAKSKLDDASYELDSARLQYTEGLIIYYESKSNYEWGLTQYEQSKAEADEKFAAAEAELEEAHSKIEASEDEFTEIFGNELSTYALDRSANSGYVSYENDASIIEGIARFLPIFFFLVAALVCTTTMTRMVDEHRTQIGTLKALGYDDGRIILKYIGYSGTAALIGCILGFMIGSVVFPKVIWNAYKMLYDFGEIGIVFNVKNGIVSLLISLLCTAGATFIACKKELLDVPADLIRPKAPKPGKRVVLERIPFIWNHLSFLNKVAARNILRYTRRLIMMLLGICGCTALILVGFGLHDSIANVVNDQFDNITRYDYSINFINDMSSEDREAFRENGKGLLDECVFAISDSVDIKTDNGNKTANIIATADKDISDIVRFSLDGNVVAFPSDGGVIINEKLAGLAGVKVGDKMVLCLNETDTVEARVDGIFENYVYNLMFMNEATYKSLFNNNVGYRMAYATTDSDDVYDVSAQIMKMNGVSTVLVADDVRTTVSDMMDSMNYIITVIVLSACALAFVVAYNLGNITIVERTREIATLKVLGFQSSETSAYVSRENIIITIVGSLLGLPCGYFLNQFVMSQINIDMISFDIKVLPLSYVYAFIITIVLSVIIALLLRKKIDMINPAESLKSVD